MKRPMDATDLKLELEAEQTRHDATRQRVYELEKELHEARDRILQVEHELAMERVRVRVR